MLRAFYLILFFINVLTLGAEASVEHTLLRRIAVFPIAESRHSSGEEAWWQMREALTKDQRFFVASRRFMINRGVFQPRKGLKPADAIILGKILDAQALVVSYIDDRDFVMKVYDGENGYLLWEGQTQFHPAIPINDQLIKVSVRLIGDFVAAVPYQGFQIIDDVIGKPVYESDGKKIAQVYIGANSQVEAGDTAQWIDLYGDPGQAFFSATNKVEVIAEGRVLTVKGDKAEVEILKLKNFSDLKENSLIRFPKEVTRLQDSFMAEERPADLSHEYLSGEVKSVDEVRKDHNSTASALAWIVNLIGFVLLAF